MRVTRHKRQILLFFVAILLPAGALIGLASRILYQDRELGAKRAVDQRRAAVEQVRRELSSRLEAIKLQEINRLMRPPSSNGARGSRNPAVVFTARLENDRPVLPWEEVSLEATPTDESVSNEFTKHRQAGEVQEFTQKDYAAAAAAYRLALASARGAREGAEARLLLARTLSKSGNSEEASRQYRVLLNGSADTRDEQGVGFRFYAAERLVAAGRDPDTVRSNKDSVSGFLSNAINGEGRLTLPELYMIRSLLGSPLGTSPDLPTGQNISKRITEMEQVAALANSFPWVRAQIESGTAREGSAWVPYGKVPWLVTMTSPQPPLPGLVIAVSSAMVVPPGVKLLNRSAEGDLLGEAFPGLRVMWTDSRFPATTRQGLRIGIWIAALALVMGTAVFGGYLLLRDVNRDVRMTEVRSIRGQRVA
jgi:hypothetical protein